METDRAPGIRAEMTRGPEGSTVRSNIAPILADAAAAARGSQRAAPGPSQKRSGRHPFGRRPLNWIRQSYLTKVWIQSFAK
jgi:hypothetical protein